MTVKELIMEVGFDDLLPYLKEIIVGHFDNIYAFREAYDILRDMQPNPEFVATAGKKETPFSDLPVRLTLSTVPVAKVSHWFKSTIIPALT